MPGRIRVGEAVQAAKLIRHVDPIYPALASQAGIQGVVRMSLILSRDGTVSNITLISGHPLLVPAAIEAVKQWVYQPTLLNGTPVEVSTEANVTLSLDPTRN